MFHGITGRLPSAVNYTGCHLRDSLQGPELRACSEVNMLQCPSSSTMARFSNMSSDSFFKGPRSSRLGLHFTLRNSVSAELSATRHTSSKQKTNMTYCKALHHLLTTMPAEGRVKFGHSSRLLASSQLSKLKTGDVYTNSDRASQRNMSKSARTSFHLFVPCPFCESQMARRLTHSSSCPNKEHELTTAVVSCRMIEHT